MSNKTTQCNNGCFFLNRKANSYTVRFVLLSNLRRLIYCTNAILHTMQLSIDTCDNNCVNNYDVVYRSTVLVYGIQTTWSNITIILYTMQRVLDPKKQDRNHFLHFLLYLPSTHVLSHLYITATTRYITTNFPYDMTSDSVG